MEGSFFPVFLFLLLVSFACKCTRMHVQAGACHPHALLRFAAMAASQYLDDL